ncbi:hypothetical protein TNCV_2318701 [Trichonephila clavipes]|nr:hypothetical protein TNCV_2318701 [Trichonephila clavipes]
MASTTDEHREISAALKAQGEEFYPPHLSERSLKVVIKGLPQIHAKFAEIKEDLLNQGVPVMKQNAATCQLSLIPSTKASRVQRSGITATTDNHNSANCFMKPRCLKCSKRSTELESVPLRNAFGHTPLYHQTKTATRQTGVTPGLPKIKNRKGAPAENRNKATPSKPSHQNW